MQKLLQHNLAANDYCYQEFCAVISAELKTEIIKGRGRILGDGATCHQFITLA